MPRKMSTKRLYRTRASSACSSERELVAMISGVAPGILMASSLSLGVMRLMATSLNSYFALPQPSITGDFIRVAESREPVGVRQIMESVDASGAYHQARFRVAAGMRCYCFRIERNTITHGIEHGPRQPDRVSDFLKGFDQFIEKPAVRSDGQPFDILKDEIHRIQFRDNADEVLDEAIARVVEYPLADQ
jgi:hypothetical protein